LFVAGDATVEGDPRSGARSVVTAVVSGRIHRNVLSLELVRDGTARRGNGAAGTSTLCARRVSKPTVGSDSSWAAADRIPGVRRWQRDAARRRCVSDRPRQVNDAARPGRAALDRLHRHAWPPAWPLGWAGLWEGRDRRGPVAGRSGAGSTFRVVSGLFCGVWVSVADSLVEFDRFVPAVGVVIADPAPAGVSVEGAPHTRGFHGVPEAVVGEIVDAGGAVPAELDQRENVPQVTKA
jgi:hypothetical protein